MAEETVNPLGLILGGAGSLLNAFATVYAVGEQRKEGKATRKQQDAWFQQNFGLEQQGQAFNQKMGRENLKLTKRQLKASERANARATRLSERTARASEKLAGRQMTVTEAESGSNIKLGERGMAINEAESAANIKTQKFNQVATVLTNMTRFFNSPQNNAQFVSLWRGR
jgi:hypothetical protein